MLAGGNPTHHDTDSLNKSATFKGAHPPPKLPLYQRNFANANDTRSFWFTGKLTGLMDKLFNLCRKKTLKMSRKVRSSNVNVLKTNSRVYFGRVSHIPGAWSSWRVHFVRWRLMFAA
jgi:hypothetical protein